ncbi:MAG: TIGR03790 family protein [Verrucomicrobiota bacterium]
MIKHFFTAVLASLLLFSGLLRASSPAEDAAATVVAYNVKDPDAKGLADFYCASRAIDPSREIALSAPVTEEISRSDYDSTLAGPLRNEFVKRGYWILSGGPENHPAVTGTQIRYLVLIRGLPLKIMPCTDYPGDSKIQPDPFGGRNEASVDSELTLLGLFTPQISGVLKNPLCNTNLQADFHAQIPPCFLFVARLDAPTPAIVKKMVHDGLKAEKEGLWGWGYIDLRSITDPGYVIGDQWIKQAGEAMRQKGIPVLTDDLPDTFQEGFPITDASAYFGWYAENINGPFADSSFRFVPGAVAAHLHSFSAVTLRDPMKGWTAPLLCRGAGASVGNVYEPYLTFTTDFGVMETALLAGCNMAESYYMAQPVLSWMSVLVADPLYRPYEVLNAEEIPNTSVWTDYLQIIRSHRGSVIRSAIDLVHRAREKKESLYLEALGSAQLNAGYLPPAEASFREAGQIETNPVIQFRLLLEQARVLEKEGRGLDGASLLNKNMTRFSGKNQKGLLLAWIARMDPIKPTASPPPRSSPSPGKS